ncbi:hypothetical protein WR25_12689 [Diploscapter pachys]|uniref:VWFA domain-containing protein n=1 Tax=Diploscapter pachys TaxID=2018661 RepID=A0A2A2J469_9BILA|nr:hypothetical protein WR25_12689 [Diploscapter pachys]
MWESVSYDPSLSGLSLDSLLNIDTHKMKFEFFALMMSSENCGKIIGSELQKLLFDLRFWVSEKARSDLEKSLDAECSWQNRLQIGLEAMINSVPPCGTPDPSSVEVDLLRQANMQLKMVLSQLECLGEFREKSARLTPQCDRRHPVIQGMREIRQKLEEECSELSTTCSIPENSDLDVYLPFRNQYSHLRDSLEHIADSIRKLAPSVLDLEKKPNESDKQYSSRINMLAATLHTAALSFADFRRQLLTNHLPFIDVYATFLLAHVCIDSAFREVTAIIQSRKFAEQVQLPKDLNLKLASNFLQCKQLEDWAIESSSSVVPLKFKATLMRKRLGISEDQMKKKQRAEDVKWLADVWHKWYTCNVAKEKEKEFEYREKTAEEKEELEMDEYFSMEVLQGGQQQVVSDVDLVMLLNSLVKEKEEERDPILRDEFADAEARFWLTQTSLKHLLVEAQVHADSRLVDRLNDFDLRVLNFIIEKLQVDARDQKVFNVYKMSSMRLLKEALELLKPFTERAEHLSEKWPEMASLKSVLASVKEFHVEPLSSSQMRFAVLLENTIEQADEWEKVASRKESMESTLNPLKKLLVEWKKLEVDSWGKLLDRVEAETRHKALLVAYPLFSKINEAYNSSSKLDEQLIAMSTNWIHDATIVDFETRILTTKCLAEWANRQGFSKTALHLHSLAAHFSLYESVVNKKLSSVRDPALDKLREHLNIYKFTDLNLHNLKAHSKAAHGKFFRHVKKHRERISLSVLLEFDTLLSLEKFEKSKDLQIPELQSSDPEEGRAKRAKQLVEKIIDKVILICETKSLDELCELASGTDESVKAEVKYEGTDEEKEKQQGHARNSRQRQVAMFIKEAQSVGLSARKAQNLDFEKIARMSLLEVALQKDGEKVEEEIVRICAGGRNACMRKWQKVSDQLSPSTRKHIYGVIEYGLLLLIKDEKRFVEMQENQLRIREVTDNLQKIRGNAEADWIVDQSKVSTQIRQIHSNVDQLRQQMDSMLFRIDQCADDELHVQKFAPASQLHPLVRLHKAHPKYEILRKYLGKLNEIVTSLEMTLAKLQKDKIIERDVFVASKGQISESIQKSTELWANPDLTECFSDQKQQFMQTLQLVSEQIQEEFNLEKSEVQLSIDPLLLVVQHLYKAIVEAEEEKWTNSKIIDKIQAALKTLDSVLKKASRFGKMASNFDEVCTLSAILCALLDRLLNIASNWIRQFGFTYHAILSLAMQLFEKGYLNPIPKMEKGDSEGRAKDDDSTAGGGMGEGEASGNAKDVTEEMEETGQIEGLQDDEEPEPQGLEGKNEKPIEMEEDFSENLQDIDKNEAAEEEDQNESEDEEDQIDPEDEMGDVDEADDKQVDPKLWDENEEKQDSKDKNIDDEQQAADNKTNELTAKEDETAPLDENQQEQNEEEQEEAMENVDERDREEEQQNEDSTEQTADLEQDISQQQDSQEMDEDDQQGEDQNQDESIQEEEDLTDTEEEKQGDADNEIQESQNDVEMDDDSEAQENRDDVEAETMDEEGHGGEKKDIDQEKNEDAGGAMEDERDAEEDRPEPEGQGQSKNDQRGEKGSGQEAKEKENDEKEENIEEDIREAQKESDRQLLADNVQEEDMEAEEAEGEENEQGKLREKAAAAQRQMQGASSMEEAKQTKDLEKKERDQLKRHNWKGIEHTEQESIEHSEDALERSEAKIHLAAEDLFSLGEELTKELVLGGDQSTSEENPHLKRTSSALDAEKVWPQIVRSVAILAGELAEKLRLVLEPQRANRMQGDYRTGKRLNMRRLVTYIASEYRKDRIWMRRTKKAQKEYQVLVAVDDSASMQENAISQVTCEAVCVLEEALRRCDAGAVAVCSFGSQVEMLIPFGSETRPGPELIRKLTFDQKQTNLSGLLTWAHASLQEVKTPSSEQMLVIISDGRGVFADRIQTLRSSLARLQGVTVLFVIMDTGDRSITDVTKVDIAPDGVTMIMRSYMDVFPFPFYALVKNIQQLPSVLAESLRQWLELTTANS